MLGLSVFPCVAQQYIKKPLAKQSWSTCAPLWWPCAHTTSSQFQAPSDRREELTFRPAIKMILARPASPARVIDSFLGDVVR